MSAVERDNDKLHVGIAEQGKLYALGGDHVKALTYYRQAIHMAVQAGEPEVFFRHYLECVMESLERMGSYEEVLAYCDKAIELYRANPPADELADWDLAHIHQRRGAVLLKRGEGEAARAAFDSALECAKRSGRLLPLAETLRGWIDNGLHIEPERVQMEQDRRQYFSVRRDAVDASRAVKLPNEPLFAAPGL